MIIIESKTVSVAGDANVHFIRPLMDENLRKMAKLSLG